MLFAPMARPFRQIRQRVTNIMNKILILSFTTAFFSVSASADQVIIDDLIVNGSPDGSLCVGAECIDGEVFDFDTVKLKTNDPIIKFVDTSSSSSFPTNDWAIGITDNGVPAPAQFFINDVSGASTVLLMEAGATGGIALGAGSTVEANAISVGSPGLERRIVNVADGVADSDATTMAQFNAFSATVNGTIAPDKAALDVELVNLQTNVDSLSTRLDAVIDRLNGL